MHPSPRSLILDLLSSTRGRAIPVRALVAAGELFGISAPSIRVALVRLGERGLIARNERGQYCLAPAAAAVQEHVASWTRLEQRMVPWQGGWLAVHTAGLGSGDRSQARQRARAPHLLGFRALAPNLLIRPANLAGGVAGTREALVALGLDADALVFALSDLDPASEQRARGLWDGEQIRRGYRTTVATLQRSAARLPTLPLREAMVESFVLGGQAIRQLARDPLLPEPIVPAAERTALVETMRAYDRQGRECWREFMRVQGAPHLDAPRSAVPVRTPRRAVGGYT